MKLSVYAFGFVCGATLCGRLGTDRDSSTVPTQSLRWVPVIGQPTHAESLVVCQELYEGDLCARQDLCNEENQVLKRNQDYSADMYDPSEPEWLGTIKIGDTVKTTDTIVQEKMTANSTLSLADARKAVMEENPGIFWVGTREWGDDILCGNNKAIDRAEWVANNMDGYNSQTGKEFILNEFPHRFIIGPGADDRYAPVVGDNKWVKTNPSSPGANLCDFVSPEWGVDIRFAKAIFTTAVCCKHSTHSPTPAPTPSPTFNDFDVSLDSKGHLDTLNYTTTQPLSQEPQTQVVEEDGAFPVWFDLKKHEESGRYQPSWEQGHKVCQYLGGKLCTLEEICTSSTSGADGFTATGGQLNPNIRNPSYLGVDSHDRKQVKDAAVDRDMWVPYRSGDEKNNWVMTSKVVKDVVVENGEVTSSTRVGGPCWAHPGANPNWTRPFQANFGIDPRAFAFHHGDITDPHLLHAQGEKWDWAYQITESLCCVTNTTEVPEANLMLR